jgi:signal transduction histidine kinase
MIKNAFKQLTKIIFNIIKLPYTALKFFIKLFSFHIKKLRFSIKRKITFNYIVLYIISCIFTLLIVVSGYFCLQYELVIPNKTNRDKEILKECNTNEELYSTLDKIAFYRDAEIFIVNLDDSIIYTDSKHNLYEPYPHSAIDFIGFVKKHTKIPYKSILLFNNNYYKLYYYFNLDNFILQPSNIAGLVIISQIFGLIIIWLFGSLKSRKVLKPIYTMTKTAEEITIRNLDARLNVNEAKYELKDLAFTLNRMLDNINIDYTKQKRFVSDVSHELRTPISIIHGYASMLQRWGKKDEEVLNESIEAIKNEAENMKDLVENLLFLARHDNQTLKYNKENFYLDQLLNEVIKETGIIDKKHIIAHEIKPDIFIYGDRNRLKQAIRIFVDNAIKYTPSSGKITLKAYKSNEYIHMSIKDTGIGISKDDLGNIFNRFYRSDKSRTRQTGGHGLGLSIAKIIILGHNGTIKVRSKLEQGSEIIVTLPSS